MEIRKRLRAFTLVELLIVITIIGILAVALVPRITGAPGKARDAARKADLQQIATGLELYADDHGGAYPSTSGCVADIAGDLTGYLTSVPSEPGNGTLNGCGVTGYGYEAVYGSVADGYYGYILTADLEGGDYGDSIYENDYTVSYRTFTASSVLGADFTACVTSDTCDDPVYVIAR